MNGREGLLGGMLSSTGLGPVLRLMPWVPAMVAGAGTAALTFLALGVWYGLTRGDEAVLYEELMIVLLLAFLAGAVAGIVVKLLGRERRN